LVGLVDQPFNTRGEVEMNINGLSKAAVLAALYNASKPQGMGFMHYDPTPMTVEEAQAELDGNPRKRFDYLKGRVMKITLIEDEVDTWGYNRDNGEGAAERAIDILRSEGDPNAQPIRDTHNANTHAAAVDVERHLGDHTTVKTEGGIVYMHLGLADVREHLAPQVAKVTRRN